jgi:Protein of unknown function (DUF2934)
MTTESLEELRERMLRNDGVRDMIRARAYEIYRMRGLQPGGAAQDWLQAESEVLAFLLAHNPEELTENIEDQIDASSSTQDPREPATPKKRKPRSTSKETAAKKTAIRKAVSKKSARSDSKPKRPRTKSKSEVKPA